MFGWPIPNFENVPFKCLSESFYFLSPLMDYLIVILCVFKCIVVLFFTQEIHYGNIAVSHAIFA